MGREKRGSCFQPELYINKINVNTEFVTSKCKLPELRKGTLNFDSLSVLSTMTNTINLIVYSAPGVLYYI